MARVVLDTNNLISALGWKKGNPRIIFQHCLSGKNRLVESKDLIKEFILVINRPKFDFISKEEKQKFLIYLFQICDLIEPKNSIRIIKDDPMNNIVLECAVEGKADFIVSGYKHLLKLKEFRGIRILNSKEFLNINP